MKVEGYVLVQHPQHETHGHYPVVPGNPVSGQAHWLINPPVKQPGQTLWASVSFTDAYGRKYPLGVQAWRYRG